MLQGLWRVSPDENNSPAASSQVKSTFSGNRRPFREDIDIANSDVVDLSPPEFWSYVINILKQNRNFEEQFVVAVAGSLLRDRLTVIAGEDQWSCVL